MIPKVELEGKQIKLYNVGYRKDRGFAFVQKRDGERNLRTNIGSLGSPDSYIRYYNTIRTYNAVSSTNNSLPLPIVSDDIVKIQINGKVHILGEPQDSSSYQKYFVLVSGSSIDSYVDVVSDDVRYERPSVVKDGYVYVASNRSYICEGLVKIGSTTTSVSDRMSELSAGQPYGFFALFYIACKDPRALEHRIHVTFACYRYKCRSREWFWGVPLDNCFFICRECAEEVGGHIVVTPVWRYCFALRC